jgi:WD40 repeat protein
MPAQRRVIRAVLSKDGRILAALESVLPGRISRWLLTERGEEPMEPLRLDFQAASLAISMNDVLAVGDSASSAIHLFDVRTDAPKGRFEISRNARPVRLAFSPSGNRLAAIDTNRQVFVWNVETGDLVMGQTASQSGLRALAFCGNDDTLLTAGLELRPTLWNVNRGEPIGRLRSHPGSIQAVTANDDGSILATGTWVSNPRVSLFDGTSFQRTAVLSSVSRTGSVQGIRICRDGRTLIAAQGSRVCFWDLLRNEERFHFAASTSVEPLHLSTDERTLVVAGGDGRIRLFRAASPEEVQAVPGWWRIEDDQ